MKNLRTTRIGQNLLILKKKRVCAIIFMFTDILSTWVKVDLDILGGWVYLTYLLRAKPVCTSAMNVVFTRR